MASKVAVVPGPRMTFVDHLIPLCHLLDIPIHCSDSWVATCAEQFYPKTEVISNNLSNYQTFVVVESCRLHAECVRFGEFIGRTQTTIAGFHGNPDKYRDTFWIERYAFEDTVLVYGEQIIDYLKEKGVWERLKKTVRIGNLRYAFYKQHQAFFDEVAKPLLFPDTGLKTILWAPTWTIEPSWEIPFEIPKGYQLLIKPHPYMYRMNPEILYPEQDNIRVIPEVPLVYPILNQADIFIGDDSSMAYDFLAFNRPIYTIGSELKRPWAGKLWERDTLAEERKKAYAYAFGGAPSLEEIKEQLI